MMRRSLLLVVCAVTPLNAQPGRVSGGAGQRCETAGLQLPDGFCATVFSSTASGARHVVVAPNGDVFVNTQPPGPQARLAGRGEKGTILALRDLDRDGRADTTRRFGVGGGTGIALQGNFLYATAGNSIVRYRLPSGSLTPAGPPDTIVTGMPTTGHRSNNFVIVGRTLYVNIGSASNSCQQRDRQRESRGADPCVELETRAGIWEFDINRLRQRTGDGRRFATGIRNAVALTRNPFDGALYATVHGRDQLHDSWPGLYTTRENAENPGEVMIRVDRGADYGWPYCYHDMVTQALVLAPEYGGDKRTVGQCANKTPALMSFPAHWAPNGMVFYTSSTFPSQYRGGAFIAFHGSWNRAPLPQAGFRVVFAPFSGNAPTGRFTTFADGFMARPPGTARVRPGPGIHRPVGLAESPDGALYITDDAGGTIYKVAYPRNRRN
ncbi:MAG TPA: PQQ-dependent sugar dehydrogenase [Gemmatimonadaceae bacterium]|nr:PQQ-dependent sugar dehydrogenase [Gemmatimonadaceae bacterium]